VRIVAAVLAGFVPGFSIAYFPLQVFGIEMRLVKFSACGVRPYF
jgi:hypothetical protein